MFWDFEAFMISSMVGMLVLAVIGVGGEFEERDGICGVGLLEEEEEVVVEEEVM